MNTRKATRSDDEGYCGMCRRMVTTESDLLIEHFTWVHSYGAWKMEPCTWSGCSPIPPPEEEE